VDPGRERVLAILFEQRDDRFGNSLVVEELTVVSWSETTAVSTLSHQFTADESWLMRRIAASINAFNAYFVLDSA